MLQESLVTCTATAKRHRLGCLQAFIGRGRLDLSDRSNADMVAQLLGEVLLCTKESNQRAREASGTL